MPGAFEVRDIDDMQVLPGYRYTVVGVTAGQEGRR